MDLDSPPKPRQTADWLTRDEFAAMVTAASDPRRKLDGLPERDRLVLLALVTTGLRRAELIGLDWQHLVVDGPQPSALVHGEGDRPRRQPLAPALAYELRLVREERRPAPTDPVFCGLQARRPLHRRPLRAWAPAELHAAADALSRTAVPSS